MDEYKVKPLDLQCPVHGNIRFPTTYDIARTVKSFMESPEFQRLERIKQTGLVHKIYYSLTHTRKEHCVGVAYLSLKYFNYIVENSDDKWNCYLPYGKLIAVAGLCHDLGHGPLSHLFEIAMKLKIERHFKMKGSKFDHEEYSVSLMQRINKTKKLLTYEEERIVSHMITGRQLEGYPNWLFQIVNNSIHGLDADKMDYLRRDAYHAGLGEPRIEYIIKNAMIDESGNLIFSEKSRYEIEHLFVIRKFMYNTVYYHPTVRQIDQMMLCPLLQIDFDLNNPDFLLDWDDASIYYAIKYILKHDVIKHLDNNTYDHKCDKCPEFVMNKPATLSSNTDKNPLDLMTFYGES